MKRSKESAERLKEVLVPAYRERDRREVGERWLQKVMGTIRSMESVRPADGFFRLMGDTVWRFAPVACGILLVLAGLILKFYRVPGEEISRMALDDPVGFSVIESLAMMI